jgi:hypothetical protein
MITGNAKFKIVLSFLHFAFCILNSSGVVFAAGAGQAQAGGGGAPRLVDRVLARVGGNAITLTDVQAAIGLGVAQPRPGEESETAAREQLIERELLLAEIARFPPPEPSAADIEKEVASLEANAGRRLETLMQATGLDAQRIREIARDSLRIEVYLSQRFGGAAAVSEDDARQYYDAHPAEFTRGGNVLPFLEVQADARQRASDERRRTLVTQWLRDLRARADVVVVGRSTSQR